ncbi:uncharacterized protein LOC129619310 [Condylostylus longicornis]|uniref:uncharacterized protein LOC129619310 n=1 Tax=Condylostylus longicornis TaxID=2530218 RepID=UPI00244E156B|nr:uncharacterized protein LOC129619310 [Condylostylus longicornis]XP_055390521.1 uncharacterized protein LOC129619310 [Condylostylus longicornis]XP_055390522.1 uncharacterized protein LOC129619310 [Condylostylus longicornis]XP_055390523.1 uncharacterized protein LOC129619310 [Condylostylus longicornis]
MVKSFINFNLFTKYTLIGLVLLSFFEKNVSCDTISLNGNLVECYRRENLKALVPNTLQVLLEIIRKLENSLNTAGDIRLLSVKLLHHLRFDGMQRNLNASESEFVIPYSPNDLLSQKHSILLKLISNVPGDLKFEEYLTPLEICTLHKILSSTIEPIVRGDEHLTCDGHKYDFPANRIVENESTRSTVISYQISRCPIESGTIRTRNFGTISPGILIASIAAGLQPQAVQLKELFPYLQRLHKENNNFDEARDYNDDNMDYSTVYGNQISKHNYKISLLSTMNDRINNTFASNLAGDLAEVCIFQSPYYNTNVHVGTPGNWNSFEYPTSYYIKDSNNLNWFMTDSEILTSIDGYYISNNIHSWISSLSLLRLSQVIELYYSKKGIPNFKIDNLKRKLYTRNEEISNDGGIFFKSFNDIDSDVNSACKRRDILKNIERQKLKYETYLFAKLMQYTAKTPLVEDETLKIACDNAVDKFFERASFLIENFGCKGYSRAMADITLILDGSRNQSENFKLISYISEISDVTPLSTKISVINGMTGQYMIKSTKSIINGFQQLKQFNGRPPQGLSLTKSLSTIIFSLENSTNSESSEIVGLSPVIIIFSQSQRIFDNDFDDAKRLIEGSFKYNQNIYFLFVTDDAARFEDLVASEKANPLNSKDKFTVIKTENLDVKAVSTELLRKIRFIPKWLRPLSCDFSQYEDYIGTEFKNFYRINSYEMLHNRHILVQFQVADLYGVITVCKNVDNQPSECITSKNSQSGEILFEINDSCVDDNNCPAVNFVVELDTTNIRCTELTCRSPDEIRYHVGVKRLGCNTASLVKPYHFYILLFIFFIHLQK